MLGRTWALSLPLLLSMMNLPNATAARPQRLAARSCELRRDIEYARVNGASLGMDACLPESTNKAPAVIIVHGGGWVRGNREVDVAPLFEPLRDGGFAWFSIDYRLATDVTQFGVAIDDVRQSIRFVKSHAAEFHIDPDRLALIGESAGGQLAAMAALRGGADESVKAVVALYAPTDLVTLVKTSEYIPARIRNSVQGTPWEGFILAGLAQLSPANNVRRDMPPFLFIHGTADSLVPFSQSRDMCNRMRQAGASCELYPVEGAGHGLRWWESYPKLAQGYKLKLVQWLREQLGAPDTLASQPQRPS
jgi:acetyl esterase/lipase